MENFGTENGKTENGWTDAQRKKIFSEMYKARITADEMEKFLGFPMSEMTKEEASMIIDCFVGNHDLSETLDQVRKGHGKNGKIPNSGKPVGNIPPVPASEKKFTVEPGLELAQKENASQQQRVYGYSPEEIELVKTNFAYGATDAELRLFFYIAKTRKLNPLLGEIKWVRRRKYDKEKKEWIKTASIIIGIDGARRKAQESGRLDGVEVSVIKEGNRILYGVAIVWLKGSSHPIKAEVPFDEFAVRDEDGNLMQLWKTMPETMIKKVAEMTAYRMAFPAELAGMYIDEEMQQSGMSEAQSFERVSELSHPEIEKE